MNRLGMLVDLSHVSPGTMSDALDVSRGAGHLLPFGRPGAGGPRRATCPTRSSPALSKNGGVVMVTFVPAVRVERRARSMEAWRPSMRAGMALRPTVRTATSGGRSRDACEQAHRHRAAARRHPGVADHVEHVRDVAGMDHVGLGRDFDGITTAAGRAGGCVRLPQPLRRADPAGLERRRSQEARRAQHAAGPAPGRGDRGAGCRPAGSRPPGPSRS